MKKKVIHVFVALVVVSFVVGFLFLLQSRSNAITAAEKPETVSVTPESDEEDQPGPELSSEDQAEPVLGTETVSNAPAADIEKEEIEDQSVPLAEEEEPEVPAEELPVETETPAVRTVAAPQYKKESGPSGVSEQILNKQNLLADLIKNKPIIMNFNINVEYEEPEKIVQTVEPEPPVVEPEPPVIDTEGPEEATVVEYQLKNGLVIVVESGPKIAFKPEPASAETASARPNS